MLINFYIKNQQLIFDNNYTIVAGSKNYLKAKFYFTQEWCSLTKTAVFTTGDRLLTYHVLLEENSCTVPWEVINESGFIVSVFAGDLINTNEVLVNVGTSGIVSGVTPPEPTESVYSQMISEFDNAKEQVAQNVVLSNNVLTQVSEASEQIQDNMDTHKLGQILDHPNGSVTSEKLSAEVVASIFNSGGCATLYNVDLNTYTRAGQYGVECDLDKISLCNYPENEYGGSLFVTSAVGNGLVAITQMFIPFSIRIGNTPRKMCIYVRCATADSQGVFTFDEWIGVNVLNNSVGTDEITNNAVSSDKLSASLQGELGFLAPTVNIEYDTGRKWIDGSSIYRMDILVWIIKSLAISTGYWDTTSYTFRVNLYDLFRDLGIAGEGQYHTVTVTDIQMRVDAFCSAILENGYYIATNQLDTLALEFRYSNECSVDIGADTMQDGFGISGYIEYVKRDGVETEGLNITIMG